MKYIPAAVGIVIVIALSYGAWLIARWWNYSISYEDQVRVTVCEMVKPEYLKQPCEGVE